MQISSHTPPGRAFLFLVSCLLVVLLGVFDFATGYEISFALFYLAPVALVAWYVGRRPAFAISTFAAVIWQFSNYIAGERFTNSLIPYWNAGTRLGFFVVISLLLARIRSLLDKERELSRTDHLTGVLNTRAFYNIATTELMRATRTGKPMSLAFLDLDGFKAVNDQLGHAVGDEILRQFGQTIMHNLRRSDMVARIGGDEFVLLLPETDEQGAKFVIQKIHALLMETIQENKWSVGFSIGAVTYMVCPESIHEMVKAADSAMYKAKRNGKNQIKHELFPHPA